MTELQKNYAWLENTPLVDSAPLVAKALEFYGEHEVPGSGDNPDILEWAKELGIKDYTHDVEPWCGLFMAYVCTKAGEPTIPAKPLWALNWRAFGKAAAPKAGFGDVLIFKRTDPKNPKKIIGGHIGLYIGEDPDCYHVLGGNESDSVTITRMPKGRLMSARRSLRSLVDPKPLLLPASGQLSVKEI